MAERVSACRGDGAGLDLGQAPPRSGTPHGGTPRRFARRARGREQGVRRPHARLHKAVQRPAAARTWDRVDETLAKAIQADPKSLETTLFRAEVLAARGGFKEAAALLEAADAKEGRVWIARADLQVQQGRL